MKYHDSVIVRHIDLSYRRSPSCSVLTALYSLVMVLRALYALGRAGDGPDGLYALGSAGDGPDDVVRAGDGPDGVVRTGTRW